MSGMNGVGTWPIANFFRPDTFIGDGRFFVNGTSNPVVATMSGSLKGLFTVTYGATGLQTIAFTPAGFKFTALQPVIVVSSMCADMTNTHRFFVALKGDWSNTTRSFIVQCYQDAAGAFAPPANAGNAIHFALHACEKSVK